MRKFDLRGLGLFVAVSSILAQGVPALKPGDSVVIVAVNEVQSRVVGSAFASPSG
jgi:hypothetical protein